MSESDNGEGHGEKRVTLALEALVDELVLTFDRRDGRMSIAGRVCNDEVALMMLQRALNLYEFRTRGMMVAALKQQADENARVAALLDRTRQRGG